jgi:hypothetical protein
VNAAPVSAADGVATATELTAVASLFTASATDADGDTVSYALATQAGFTIDAASGVISMDNTVVAGSYTLVVTASDGQGGSDTQSIVVTVSAAPSLDVTMTLLLNGPDTQGYAAYWIYLSGDVDVASINPSDFTVVSLDPNEVITSVSILDPGQPHLLVVQFSGRSTGNITSLTYAPGSLTAENGTLVAGGFTLP